MTAGLPRVVVVGAGPGGLEAVLALRALAGEHVQVTLVAAEPTFAYRPWSVAEPFGVGRAVNIDLGRLAADRDATLVVDRVQAVDADEHQLVGEHGRIPYDVLVLALGARQVPAVAGALTFRGPRDVVRLREALEEHCATPGTYVTFVANASAYWPLPAYELALMTQMWAERRDTPAHVALATGESAPLAAFGAAASARIRELLKRRGIALYTGTLLETVENGYLVERGAGSVRADLAVALPALIGPGLDGVPRDEAGFTPVDAYGRVHGVEDVFAIGDMTQHELKQGGLATQQADVAAARIAADAGAVCETPPYEPVLRAMLLTGEGPLYLRHPEQPEDSRPTQEVFGAPWWPPHKISGRHLAPYLAVHADMLTPVTADA